MRINGVKEELSAEGMGRRFGDGSDLDVVVPAGQTVQFKRPTYLRNLTVYGTLDCLPYELFVSNRLTVESGGVVTAAGEAGSGFSQGTGRVAKQLSAGFDGGAGGTAAGSAGVGYTDDVMGGCGGKGGAGAAGANAGGAAGIGQRHLVNLRDFRGALSLFTGGTVSTGGHTPFVGGCGGGGGGGDGVNKGGGGGAGGSPLLIHARHVINRGTITANGGAGAAGVAGNAGGGAGGGGGICFIDCLSWVGTAPTADGGAGGAGVGTGAAGERGMRGWVWTPFHQDFTFDLSPDAAAPYQCSNAAADLLHETGELDAEATVLMGADLITHADATIMGGIMVPFASIANGGSQQPIEIWHDLANDRISLSGRGGVLLNAADDSDQAVGALPVRQAKSGDYLTARWWYMPGHVGQAKTAGIRVGVNGCYGRDVVTAATAPTLSGDPQNYLPRLLDLYVGGHPTIARGDLTGTVKRVRSMSDHDLWRTVGAEGVLLGDSNTAQRGSNPPLGARLFTVAQHFTSGRKCYSAAMGGAQSSNQLTVWQASRYRGDSAVRWVVIMLGTNDYIVGAKTRAQVQTGIQAVVTDVMDQNPAAHVFLLCPVPTATALETAHAGDAANMVLTWTDIMGTSATPIVPGGGGASYLHRINGHLALLDTNGDGDMNAADQEGDNLHMNVSGRGKALDVLIAEMQTVGVL